MLACRVARERGIPYLGICLGMHVAVSEFARHVVGLDGANSTEMDPETPYPVIDLLPEQKEVEDLGGTMRLGAQAVELAAGRARRETYARRGRAGAPPAPLRGEQRVPAGARRRRASSSRARSRRAASSRSSSFADHPWFVASPVPSRVQVAADAAGAALPRVRRRGARPRARSAARSRSPSPPRASPRSRARDRRYACRGSRREECDAEIARPQRVPAVAAALDLLERVHREPPCAFEPQLVAGARERLQERVAVAGGSVADATSPSHSGRTDAPRELSAGREQLLVQVRRRARHDARRSRAPLHADLAVARRRGRLPQSSASSQLRPRRRLRARATWRFRVWSTPRRSRRLRREGRAHCPRRRGRARGLARFRRRAAASRARPADAGARERRRFRGTRPARSAPVHSCIARAASRVPGMPHMISSASLSTFCCTCASRSRSTSADGSSRHATRRIPVSPVSRADSGGSEARRRP